MTEKIELPIVVKADQSSASAFSKLRKGFKDLAKDAQASANAMLKMNNPDAANTMGTMSMFMNRAAIAFGEGEKGAKAFNKQMAGSGDGINDVTNKLNVGKKALKHYSEQFGTTTEGQLAAVKATKQVVSAVTGMGARLDNAGAGIQNFAEKVRWSRVQQALHNKDLKLTGNNFQIMTEAGGRALGITQKRLGVLGDLNQKEALYNRTLAESVGQSRKQRVAIKQLGQAYGKGNEQVSVWSKTLSKINTASIATGMGVINKRMETGNRTYRQSITSIDRFSAAQGLLAGNLRIVGGQFKVMNNDGLALFKGMTKEGAASVGLLDKAFEKQGKAIVNNRQNMSLARKEYDRSAERSDIYRTALRKLTKEYGGNSLEFKERATHYRKLDDSYRRMTDSMVRNGAKSAEEQKKMNAAFDVTKRSSEHVVKNYQNMEAAIVRHSKVTGKAKEVTQEWANTLSNQGKSHRNVASIINQTTRESQRAWTKAKSDYKEYGDVINRLEGRIGKIGTNQATKSLDAYHQAMVRTGKATTKTSQAMEFIGNKFKSFAAYTLAAASIAGLTRTLMGANTAIIAHDQALRDLEAITGATASEIERMDATIRSVADSTKFSAQEVADGMKLIGQAGFSASESMSTVQAVSDLATGTLTNLATAADLVTTTLRVFQKDASESARVADVFTNAVNNSKLTIDKIRIAMNYLGPIAARAGVSFEDTASSMMILANAGLRASSIATGLRRVIKELVNPSKKMRDSIEEAGYSIEDINPQIHDMRTVISRLSKVVKGADDAFRLFGLRGATAVSALVTQGVPAFDKMMDAVKRQGTAARNAEIQMKGLGVSWKNFADKMKNLSLAFGDAGLNDMLRLFVDTAREVVDVLTLIVSHPFLQWIVKIGVALGAAFVVLVAWPKALIAAKVATVALTGAWETLLLLFMVHPIGMVVTVLAGITVAMLAYADTIDDVISAQRKLSGDATKTIKTLKDEIDAIEDFVGSAEEKVKLLDKLAATYPSYAEAIYNTNGELYGLVAILQQVQEEQEQIKFDAIKAEMAALGEKAFELTQSLGFVDFFKSMFNPEGPIDGIRLANEEMEKEYSAVISTLKTKVIELQKTGKDFNLDDLISVNAGSTNLEFIGKLKNDLQVIIDAKKKMAETERPGGDIGIFSKWRDDLEGIPEQMKNVNKVLELYSIHIESTTKGSNRWREANKELRLTMAKIHTVGGPLAEVAQKVYSSIDVLGGATEETTSYLEKFKESVRNTGLRDLASRADKAVSSYIPLKKELGKVNDKVEESDGWFSRLSGTYDTNIKKQKEVTAQIAASDLALNGMTKALIKASLSLDGMNINSTDDSFKAFVASLEMTEEVSTVLFDKMISKLKEMREEAGKPLVEGTEGFNLLMDAINRTNGIMIDHTKIIEGIDKAWTKTTKPAKEASKALFKIYESSIKSLKSAFTDKSAYNEFAKEIRKANMDLTLSEEERANKIIEINKREVAHKVQLIKNGSTAILRNLEFQKQGELALNTRTEKDLDVRANKELLILQKYAEKKKQVYVSATNSVRTELDKAVVQYRKYANEIVALEDKIKNAKRSASDSIRALQQKGMTDEEKHADIRKQIAEKQIELLNTPNTGQGIEDAERIYGEILALSNQAAVEVTRKVEVYKKGSKEYRDATVIVGTASDQAAVSVKAVSDAYGVMEEKLAEYKTTLTGKVDAQGGTVAKLKEDFENLSLTSETLGSELSNAIQKGFAHAVILVREALAKIDKMMGETRYYDLQVRVEKAKVDVDNMRNQLNDATQPKKIEIDHTDVEKSRKALKEFDDSIRKGVDYTLAVNKTQLDETVKIVTALDGSTIETKIIVNTEVGKDSEVAKEVLDEIIPGSTLGTSDSEGTLKDKSKEKEKEKLREPLRLLETVGQEMDNVWDDLFEGKISTFGDLWSNMMDGMVDVFRRSMSDMLSIYFNELVKGMMSSSGSTGGSSMSLGSLAGDLGSWIGKLFSSPSQAQAMRSTVASGRSYGIDRSYASGGVIPEHVVGVGLKSGARYEFGEKGTEEVLAHGESKNTKMNVAINMINQTGTEIEAKQGKMQFNGDQWVVDVVMNRMATDPTFRNTFGGR